MRGYNHEQMVEILGHKWNDVTIWHTGGGVHNPVVVLNRNDEGRVLQYVIFTMDWCPVEASMAVYDARYQDGETPLYEWIGEGDKVPMTHGDIRALVSRVVEQAEYRRKAAEDWDVPVEELEPCEACPIIDEICEACGCTGWVAEGTQ